MTALALYGVASCLVVWRGHSLSREIFGPTGDPVMSTWYLRWWPYAVSHGLNPFVTDRIWHLSGYNVTWSTSVPFLSLVMSPVTYGFGPVVSYNLLCIAAPALSAWTAFLLLGDVCRKFVPALLGGWVFGFSSYEVGQVLTHLNLSFVAFVPLAVLVCKRRFDGALSRRGFVVLLGATVVAQIGTSTEVTFTLAFFGLLFWTLLLVLLPERRLTLLSLAADVAITAVPVAIVLSPFLIFLVRGLAVIPDVLNPPLAFSTDLTGFFTPSPFDLFGGRLFRSFSSQFTGNGPEQGAYVGLPLAAIAVLTVRHHADRRVAAALGAVTALICVATLGPRLHVGREIAYRLPWALTSPVPIVNSVLPCRFALYLSLCMACFVVLWLAMPRPAWQRYGLAGLGALSLVPRPHALFWSAWPSDPFFAGKTVERTLGANPVVLVLPFSEVGPGMAWQLDAGLGFAQSAGYGGYKPRGEPPATVEALGGGPVKAGFADALTAHCALHDAGFVLVGPGTPPSVRRGVAATGWPVTAVGDVDIVRVPPRATLAYVSIVGDYWPSGDRPAWIGGQVRVRTRGKPTQLRLSTALRPVQAGPEGFTVEVQGRSVHRTFAGGASIDVDLPPDADALIRADTVFTPAETMGGSDTRRLSMLLEKVGP